MNTILLPIRIILALAALSIATAPRSYATPETKAPSERRFDFEFEGGTAVDLLSVLEPLKFNFILPATADQLEIPAFSVKNVIPSEFFEALGLLVHNSHPDYEVSIRGTTKGEIWILKMKKRSKGETKGQANSDAAARERINRVAQEIRDRRELRREQTINQQENLNLVTEAINISQHLKRTSIEGISSLIRSTISAKTALTPDKADEWKIDIKFHRETSILILSGDQESVSSAIATLHQLMYSDPLPAQDDQN